ncbi:VaFE repeat-containing surface-anchored protein [Leucobacter sp. HNU]|uniref:VaFE repeat-containing surface-anchored protein n=1 Tax=Leucobacter sp. HNU TaxID=3236805 RepID=UPI003A8100DD
MASGISKAAGPRGRWWAVALLAAVALIAPSFATAANAATITNGQSVWVGKTVPGSGGTAYHGIYLQTPANPNSPGTPDFYAYCIEHDVRAVPLQSGVVGDPSSYLGSNHYTDPVIQGKVNWVLQHSYPTLSLAELAQAAGLPSISLFDATEATQYAIWRYTDLTFDASWNWNSDDSKAAYWYLVNGANASSGAPVGDPITVSVTPASGTFPAGGISGPFTVQTNQAKASVAATGGAAIVDASGDAIDTSNVVDGQQIYLDLRNATTAGSTTITATVAGASGTGHIITSPKTAGGTATAGSHGQSLVLVVPGGATTSATADANWTVPEISTTLLDQADGDHNLVFTGGTVVDTVAYKNLTPGQQYTVSGELMRKSDGSASGITGSKTFTPTAANGSVEVTFVVPAGFDGQTLVAFEKLYRGESASGAPVATHEDIDDAAQTVVVAPKPVVSAQPAISTTLLDQADGDHNLVFTGGTVVDTVAYKNLTPGQQYTVSGELMRKSDGSASGITGSKTFTPTAANGSVEVTFVVPAGFDGQTLVAFEKLYRGESASGAPVATHEDIDDAAQTVVVAPKPVQTPTTTTPGTTTGPGATTGPGGSLATTGSAAQPAVLAGVALLGLLTGVTALVLARRRRAELAETE